MSRRRRTTKRLIQERVYTRSLDQLIDLLFEEAQRQKMTWVKLAGVSGLSRNTVCNLGCRRTKYPQYRTVELIAHALGGRVQFTMGVANRLVKATWTPKVFSGRVA